MVAPPNGLPQLYIVMGAVAAHGGALDATVKVSKNRVLSVVIPVMETTRDMVAALAVNPALCAVHAVVSGVLTKSVYVMMTLPPTDTVHVKVSWYGRIATYHDRVYACPAERLDIDPVADPVVELLVP